MTSMTNLACFSFVIPLNLILDKTVNHAYKTLGYIFQKLRILMNKQSNTRSKVLSMSLSRVDDNKLNLNDFFNDIPRYKSVHIDCNTLEELYIINSYYSSTKSRFIHYLDLFYTGPDKYDLMTVKKYME